MKGKMRFKELLYKFISHAGIRFLYLVFPEYFGKESLNPTDRYVEYHFASKNLPWLPARVLDVGCAGSYFTLMLAGFGYDCYAVDIRRYTITNKIKYDNSKFLQEDIRKTSFPEDFFDAITAISTIEHIGLSGRYAIKEDPRGDIDAFKEMRRILKPGGILIITIPFGKPQILRPYMRVYDEVRVKEVCGNFKVEKEEYFMQDEADDWQQCSKEDAAKIEVKPDRYPLCLLKLRK